MGGLAESGYQPLPADLSPQFAGAIAAFACIGAVGAVTNTFVASIVLGQSKTLKDWQNLFVISGVVDLLAVLAFDVMAQAEPQPWGSGEPLYTTVTSSTTKCHATLSDTIRTRLQKLFHRKRSSVCESSALIRPKGSQDEAYKLCDRHGSSDED